jgi:transposase
MGCKPVLDPIQIARAQKLRAENLSFKIIAQRFGVRTEVVRRSLQKLKAGQ